ncbi:hypothetical protein KV557_01855 [Kitasatospora aureofaciens]|uniref:DUF6059 family protein n=1 Tax=Kitasatospora aureofaciens TaxID=1894 RepID=UPI001C4844AC|nr:DUF6059 family protein [Kitasatospora aureofaciens]MBV6695869.1 hypothetical protein [Kitasatospora aureofaciens]
MREASGWCRGLLGGFLRGLSVLGQMAGYAVPVDEPVLVDEPERDGPAPGHPERLRPDVPLSPVERALRRQLRGVAGWTEAP